VKWNEEERICLMADIPFWFKQKFYSREFGLTSEDWDLFADIADWVRRFFPAYNQKYINSVLNANALRQKRVIEAWEEQEHMSGRTQT
jgi:hypothetical protein